MMLKVMNAIENIVEKYSDDYRFINDHELNVVCQIDTDEERIELILAEIDEQLPAGIYFSHEYTCGEYEITFKEIKGADIMNEYEVKMTLLTAAIEDEFGPLDWADITVYKEEGTGSITFTGPTLSERDWKPGAFKGAEDIRDEAEQMHHCVATYIPAIEAGKKIVMFMRDKEDPDKSLVTVEVINGAITQAYAQRDTDPSIPCMIWLTKWAQKKDLRITAVTLR